MSTTWSELHVTERHHLRYPSEAVVRWLAGLKHAHTGRLLALDIGCGSGRHLRLLKDFGLETTGVDAYLPDSIEGDGIVQAQMTDLPFPDDWFDVVLAYGVFYYGSMGDADKAVHEMHRVMRPGGHAFVPGLADGSHG